ncbi:MAG: glycosyltransferase family 39 protein, partial [Anaerolineae bacterium]|nr:glycosyltransferase family 39 protein [Anaerolineae bacterium]
KLSEFHQPPLYYALAAAIAAPAWQTDHSPDRELDPTARLKANPFWAYQIGRVGVDNKNQYLHDPEEAFPYQGWLLRVHLARWLSILLQMLTILATYAIGREVFPERIDIRFGSLAFVAFVPQFLFIAGSVSNDNLIVPLTALLTWLWVRGLRTGPGTSWALAVGALTGLAVASKMSALSLVVFSLAVAVLIGWRQQQWKQAAIACGIILGLTALLAGPIMVRNQVLYGEPTALRRMSEIWGEHDPSLSIVEALRQLPNVWTSFWARFGYGQIPVPNAVYAVLIAVAAIAALGLVREYARRRPSPKSRLFWQIAVLVALAGMFVVLVVSYVRVSLTGGNGRFAFPALPAYAILLYLGLSAWIPPSRRKILIAIVYTGMVGFALAALLLWLRPAYASPPMQAIRPEPSHPVDMRYDELAKLIGYDMNAQVANPGSEVNVTLYWQVLAPTADNYTVFIHLIDSDGAVWGARDTYPGLGKLPTSQWQTGRYLVDTIAVPVDPQSVSIAPASLSLEVGLYDLSTMQRLPITGADGASIDTPLIGRLKLSAPPTPMITPPVQDRQRLGDAFALLGYEIPSSARAGQTLDIDLYWQALATPDHDYTVFLHLLDDNGNIVSQGDAPPMQGRYPTSMWAYPETLIDHHALQLPPELPAGEYALITGLYNPMDSSRLPVLNENGQVIGDHVNLSMVQIDGQDD